MDDQEIFDDSIKHFSLNDVKQMTQEEVSRIVFSFDRKTCETNIFSNKEFEYNFIRDAI